MDNLVIEKITEEIIVNLFKGDYVGENLNPDSKHYEASIEQLAAEIKEIIINETTPNLINNQPLTEQVEFFINQWSMHDKVDELTEVLVNMAARKLNVEDIEKHFAINTVDEVVETLKSWLLEDGTWEEEKAAFRIIINALGVQKLISIFFDDTEEYIKALTEIDTRVTKIENEVWDRLA